MNRSLLRLHIKWAEAARGPELFAYQDTTGHMSIGYGRNLDAKGITREEAELMLTTDIDDALKDAKSLSYWTTLSPVRQLVIADMVYNLGLPKFLRFKRLNAALKIRDYLLAGAEMKDSRWYTQTERRAKVLVESMTTGLWKGHA